MATPMEVSTTNSINYLEPDGEDESLHAQQLVSGALKLDNYRPIRELERIKFDSSQTLEMTHFSTPYERLMAESLHRNTNGWIDTAKDVLCVAIDVSGLVTTCYPAMRTGVLAPDNIARATQHAISIADTLKRIYNRACDMAVNNSNDLLLAIDSNEHTSQNLTVKTAAEQHRNDLIKFQQGKVNVNVPHQSHAKLLESIEQVEPNQDSYFDTKAKQSSRAWDLAKALGAIVLTVGIIIGFVALKR